MSFTRRQVLGGLVGLGVVGLGAGGARYWLGRPFDRKTCLLYTSDAADE